MSTNQNTARSAESDAALLRAALADLVGASTVEELRDMEAVIVRMGVPEPEMRLSLNAIRALLATANQPDAIYRKRTDDEIRVRIVELMVQDASYGQSSDVDKRREEEHLSALLRAKIAGLLWVLGERE